MFSSDSYRKHLNIGFAKAINFRFVDECTIELQNAEECDATNA